MSRTTDTTLRYVSTHAIGHVYVNPVNNHHSLIAALSFKAGDIICSFSASRMYTSPNRYTVQTGEQSHIILEPEYLQYINHSCSPNAFFDTDTFQLVALQNIESGDEFTFFYPSAEWYMSEQFNCLCGEPNCIGFISGASQLPAGIINQYRLTSFIQQKLIDSNK